MTSVDVKSLHGSKLSPLLLSEKMKVLTKIPEPRVDKDINGTSVPDTERVKHETLFLSRVRFLSRS